MAATPRPRWARRQGMAAWAAAAVLIGVQFLAFRQFLKREVVWCYPPNSDQLSYLERSYDLHEQMRSVGVRQALARQPGTANGALLEAEAALLFRLTGPSRSAALTINFIHFAAFQIAFAAALRWLSGKWSVAFMGLGLMLLLLTPFSDAGGITDFRLDFIAFCVFGIFISLVARSGLFARRGWAAAAGVAAAWLVCFRFITAAYLLPIFAAAAIICVLRRRRAAGLPGLLLAAAIVLLMAGPVLWNHRQVIRGYYLVGHVSGPEKDVRAAGEGTTQWAAAIAYYPLSLIRDHAGLRFIEMAAAMLSVAGAGALIGRRRRGEDAEGDCNSDKIHAGEDLTGLLLFAAACLAVPLVILTLDVSKSPVVADLMAAPLLWLVMLAFLRLSRGGRGDDGSRRLTNYAHTAIAMAAICLGLATQNAAYRHDKRMSHRRRELEKVNAYSDLIASTAQQARWRVVRMFPDTTADYLDAKVVKVLSFERHGSLLDVQGQLGTVLEVPPADVFREIDSCEIVVVTHRTGREPEFQYPFDREMTRLHRQIADYCALHLIEIGRSQIFDREVIVYRRPSHQGLADGS